ncbi:uncharacterized protein PHACADRAFT_175075 [Phanerochaete carnosa HHB-10118-sp]|uniref:Zinc-finger domain-containing protein n=1 Tax=Phanerochaete carnosa (strain HHB-10118-sp) TaxID=650164 RepID=K5WVS0_PHACS|nr:uncharacterized protein PHACADRAFT_175075 [Phanerochaete carnosa HHB-10118-sp]EKM54552.1 hypothetical protein PHACADRAFT_175075 [Phanerochaete carnosa HHB-10118-sp]
MPDKAKSSQSFSRRCSQVFVDVPLPAVHRRNSDESSPGPSLKENTPLRPSRMNSQSQMATLNNNSKIAKKRKASEGDSADVNVEPVKTKAKKPRLDPAAPQPDEEGVAQLQKLKAANAIKARTKQDDNTFRCHHCQRWWPNGQGLRCTLTRARSKTTDERCSTHYCFSCVQKYRRLESQDSILSRDVTELPKEQRQRHMVESGYWFECYRCRNQCDCHVCRRARGLEPIGNLRQKARQAEKAEAKAREQTLKAGSSSLSKAKKSPAKGASKLMKAAELEVAQAAKAPYTALKSKAKPKLVPKAKPLPKPLWTRVPTSLALEDVKTRLHIREFIVRFASILQLPHGCLDELDEVCGDSLGPAGGWDVDVDDSAEIVSWVSESCARFIIQSLLDAIANFADAEGDVDAARALKESVKAVKASGSNLNRVWGSLISLREALGADTTITFPDPLLPPASTTVRTTRSAMHGNDSQGIYISASAQLVPVIANLIEHAIPSPTIKEAFDSGSTEEKELNKIAKEASTKENTRWKDFSGTRDKQRRDQHSRLLRNIEFSQRLASTRCIPRWAPLGQDFEGRVYYAMTPGVGESDAAIEFLNGKESRVRIGRKREWTEDDRSEMARWSWFIAVWGKKPEGADEAEESYDERDEAWWGFWQPGEVRKLVEWLTIKCGLAGEHEEAQVDPGAAKQSAKSQGKKIHGFSSPSMLSRDASPLSELSDVEADGLLMKTDAEGRLVPVKHELEALIRRLREYAELLEWRIQRVSRERSISPEPEKPSRKFKKSSPVLA